jgi:hypothetical protein
MNLNDELIGHIGSAMRVYNSYKKIIRDLTRSLIWVGVVMVLEITLAILAPTLKIKIVSLALFALLAWHFGKGLTMLKVIKYERQRILKHIEYLTDLLHGKATQ